MELLCFLASYMKLQRFNKLQVEKQQKNIRNESCRLATIVQKCAEGKLGKLEVTLDYIDKSFGQLFRVNVLPRVIYVAQNTVGLRCY